MEGYWIGQLRIRKGEAVVLCHKAFLRPLLIYEGDVLRMSRKRRFWYDPFWEFDKMDEMMEQFLNEAMDQLKDKDGPIFYGFSVSVGPDGKPVVQEFGNVKPGIEGPQVKDEIQPLVDVVEKQGSITVYAELPGVDKDDIDLTLTEDSLTMSVQGARRRYQKKVLLPSKVKPDNAKASYKNGILEVTLEKSAKEPRRKQLKVD